MKIFKNKQFIILLSLSGAFILSAIVLILANKTNLYYPVILYVTENDGVNNLGSVWDVWRIVISGGVLIFLNSLFSELLVKKKILSYLLMISSFIISSLVFILVLYIISLN